MVLIGGGFIPHAVVMAMLTVRMCVVAAEFTHQRMGEFAIRTYVTGTECLVFSCTQSRTQSCKHR